MPRSLVPALASFSHLQTSCHLTLPLGGFRYSGAAPQTCLIPQRHQPRLVRSRLAVDVCGEGGRVTMEPSCSFLRAA